MLDPATLKWRRTAFTRIDRAVEVAEDDWSLTTDGLQAARIYRVCGGPHNGFWFWCVEIGAGGVPHNSGAGYARDGREAREACEAILWGIGAGIRFATFHVIR